MNDHRRDATSTRPLWIFWPLLAVGIALSAFGAAACVLHIFAFRSPYDSDLLMDAPLAALVVGLPAWYWYMVHPRRATITRGIVVGAICSLVAYPIMWMLAGLNPRQEFFGTGDILTSIAQFTIWGWVYAGWLTTPLGALAGEFLAALQRTLTSAVQAHPLDSQGAATTRDNAP